LALGGLRERFAASATMHFTERSHFASVAGFEPAPDVGVDRICESTIRLGDRLGNDGGIDGRRFIREGRRDGGDTGD
jgi:hypothetical protein